MAQKYHREGSLMPHHSDSPLCTRLKQEVMSLPPPPGLNSASFVCVRDIVARARSQEGWPAVGTAVTPLTQQQQQRQVELWESESRDSAEELKEAKSHPSTQSTVSVCGCVLAVAKILKYCSSFTISAHWSTCHSISNWLNLSYWTVPLRNTKSWCHLWPLKFGGKKEPKNKVTWWSASLSDLRSHKLC